MRGDGELIYTRGTTSQCPRSSASPWKTARSPMPLMSIRLSADRWSVRMESLGRPSLPILDR